MNKFFKKANKNVLRGGDEYGNICMIKENIKKIEKIAEKQQK